MKGKAIGALLGIFGVVFWFMPLLKVGRHVYEAGRQIGTISIGGQLGTISYIIPTCSAAYALFSILELHKLRVIVACVLMSVSLLFLFVAWNHAAWGLYSLSATSVLSWVAACTGWEAAKNSVEDPEG